MADGLSIKLVGAEGLRKAIMAMPADVSTRARKQGVSKAAQRLRTELRREAPRGKTKRLRASIGISGRARKWVGLVTRDYYKTLDMDTKRGAPLRPWFEAAAKRHTPAAAQRILDQTMLALSRYAGSSYAKSKVRGR